MIFQTFDIFKEENFRLLSSLYFMVNYSGDVKKESSTSVFKTFAFPRNRKSLAREAAAQNIKVWNLIQLNVVYVSIEKLVITFVIFYKKRWLNGLVIFFISYASVLVPFTCKNAFSTNGMHCRVEPSDTSKQIDELELRFAFIVLDNLFTRHFSLRVESERVHSRGSGSGRFVWPGCGQKRTAGSRLTPRLKARHFQKNTIHPQKPERIQYAQGTLRPCNPRAMASYCLILSVRESV